jgi:hypothetical protein
MTSVGKRGGGLWRAAFWGGAASLLLIPAIAMRFTTEVNWDAADFIFAAVLIAGGGVGIESLVARSTNPAYRAASVLALLAVFLTIWVNAAVGMIGSEEGLYNLLFLGVIAVAVGGALAARFRPDGMARAIAAAGVLHLMIAIGGLTADLRGALLSLAFAAPWLLSAALFRKANSEESGSRDSAARG